MKDEKSVQDVGEAVEDLTSPSLPQPSSLSLQSSPASHPSALIPHPSIVVLAAGAARRFGRPKQLERWPAPDGPTLVERAVGLALGAKVGQVYVVVGNRREQVEEVLRAAPYSEARTVYNPRWEEGQGFSVAAGIRAVQTERPTTRAILFMLADQPRLQPATLTVLLDYFANLGEAGDQAIIFPTYGGKRGNPVVFGRAYFDELALLEGDNGGRTVVRAHPAATLEVPVPDPAIHEDVDTPADLERLSR